MRDPGLLRYLQQIESFSTLNPDEERDLVKKAKKGNTKARERIITAHLKSVVSIAKLYQRGGVPISDLIDEGNLGLLKALKNFDPDRGVRFISYASWWIRQQVLSVIYHQVKAVRIPIQKLANRKIIRKIESELSQKLGRMPTTEEIASVLGVSPHEVSKAIEITQSDLSLNASISKSGDASLLDFIKSNSEHLETVTIKELFEKEICERLITLNEREILVIKLYFGLDGNEHHTLREIGEKLGLSRERIRQIKEKALKRLRAGT